MPDISKNLIAELVAYARTRRTASRIDDLKEEVLNHAFDNLGFDGEEEALWAKVRAGAKAKSAPPWDPRTDADLATAPFRFVPMNETVSRLPPDSLTPHDKPLPGHMSCILDVDWRVETPLLIGELDGDVVMPFRLGDDYAIPGATLRGAIRAVVEALAFGRLFQTNRHKRFALRDFAHPSYGTFMTQSQGDPGLQAGWLTLVDGEPHITPCEWGYVKIDSLPGNTDRWVTQNRHAKYRHVGSDWKGPGAFTRPRMFEFRGTEKDRNLYSEGRVGTPGHYVFSGKLPGGGGKKKLFEYVFFETAARPVPLADGVWDTFVTTNSKPSQNKRVADGAWKEFESSYKQGGRVPVFFVGDLARNAADETFSFGLTRLYRIPHRDSIGEVLLRSGQDHRPAEKLSLKKGGKAEETLELRPDFVENLFGYVYEPKDLEFGHGKLTRAPDYTPPGSVARKGRVAFEFARPVSDARFRLWPESGPVETAMGAPKPAFAPFYLVGAEKDYSRDGARLAGRKRYIARYRAGQDAPSAPLKEALAGQISDGMSKDMKARLRFLAPDPAGPSVFRGRIRCHNVSRAELGALLWALTFGGDRQARHLIGRGRPFGAGQIAAQAITLRIRPNLAPRDAAETVEWTEAHGRDRLTPWLEAFEALMEETVRGWKTSAQVQALLRIARPRGWAEQGTTYLPYQPAGERQAEHFARLRKVCGPGAIRAPDRLLPP
ncbi:hypothetical protein NHU_04172 [Rhodovulum sulfidophilum]|uniref:TIGR03986 family CRISPR-associated RAMP protein n=1 Tax=Rhodovulum sulfidophilum TaxID=35806 RepID=A0A0D6B871_RHOSU|nr:hypothetical protein NHU_04172 [Rhodovulum sulfidophilum]